MAQLGLWWVSRDLRLSDNAALLAALADGPLLPVFFVDKLTLGQGAASRWRLERGLRAVDSALRQRMGGRGLTILRGEPDKILPILMQKLGAIRVHQSDWPAPQMRHLQQKVQAALAPMGGQLSLHAGHLLIHPSRLRTTNGTAYKVYSPFARALRRLGPDQPLHAPPLKFIGFSRDLPPEIVQTDLERLDLAPDLYRGRAALDHFALPAGEEAAFARLDAFFDSALGYSAGRDYPDQEVTSNLSEHLAFGEISPRSLWAIAQLRAEIEPALASGITHFLSEVLWREFAWHLLIELPSLPEKCWREEWESFPWRKDGKALERWQRAQTGVAMVDAGLREMWLTGRMHNRVRMVVASWLTKHLLTDWRAGLAHFADCLTDWDPAANAMNWQWVAGCGPDASPYFRIFNPKRQKEQFDRQGIYCKRWLAGFEGATTHNASLWAQSVPPHWQAAGPWRAGPDEDLTKGREDALQALADFRLRDDYSRFDLL